jgi:predicted Rossmann fold flavoprotein
VEAARGSSLSAEAIIIGAGAAGMMCAITAGQRGRRVLLLDGAANPAEKIRISGGGRCNFTNLNAKPESYLSANPHFCRSALARYTPQHFVALLDKHGIGYHEKKLGQLFCDDGSAAIIKMLLGECDAAGVRRIASCEIQNAGKQDDGFLLNTSRGAFAAPSLVVASGGLSVPKTGATPLGYRIAQQFGIPVTRLKPGLVPLSFHPEAWAAYAELAGISVEAVVGCGKRSFRENLLFTHRGLSGPAILQISSYWEHGQPLHINLLPEADPCALADEMRASRMLPRNFLAQYLPQRFAEVWCAGADKPLNQYSDQALAAIAARLHDWLITPTGTLGYSKAEVTCGGVDTRALSSKTMQSNDVPGLYFIGEVVDVTGQLGGFNFQWAWASGRAAGEYV